ncbi:MAG: cupin domain-containing protein [Candidatus Izemoplasmatales bacterium]|jgi:quercetin dioxygenase-like cupin family protein|nr:cupin domain-containing protein [Candidatus Izemoplasmatales bacterium]
MKPLNIKEMTAVLNKYNVQAKTLVDHDNATIKNLYLNPGQAIPDHKVPMDVTFFILEGTGSITIGGETVHVKPYDCLLCPPHTVMSVRADDKSHLSFLNIKTPGLKS